MKTKVYVYENDTFRIHLMTATEAFQTYCYETDDLNLEIDQSLIDRYRAIEVEYQSVQRELREAIKQRYAK